MCDRLNTTVSADLALVKVNLADDGILSLPCLIGVFVKGKGMRVT
jgi:hypothetical protein